VLQVRVHASSGQFAGTADPYVAHGELTDLAEALAGYPEKAPIEVELGGGSGLDRVQLSFYTEGRAIRCAVRVVIAEYEMSDPPQTSDFILPIEPVVLDRLREGLRRLDREKSGGVRIGTEARREGAEG